MVNNIHPTSFIKLDIKSGWRDKKHVYQESFKGKFTTEEIREYVQNQSDSLKEKGIKGSIMINTRWNKEKAPNKNDVWKTGMETEMGEKVNIYTESDSDEEYDPGVYAEFRIYFLKD